MRSYTFRLTQEGVAELEKDFAKLGDVGAAAMLKLEKAAPGFGAAMEASAKRAEAARQKLEATTKKELQDIATLLDGQVRQAEQNFKGLRASLDPAYAAQMQYARGQEIVADALKRTNLSEKEAMVVKQQLEQQLRRSTGAVTGYSTGLMSATRMMGMFAGAMGAIGAVGLGKVIFSDTAALVDQAKQLQQTTDALQAYRAEFRQGGSSDAQADKSIGAINTLLGQAIDNLGEARRQLSEWNIDWRELAAVAPDQRLALVARGLLAIEDGGRRARAEQALFGKTGREVETVMESLAGGIDKVIVKQRELKNIKSAETALEAKRAADQIAQSFEQFKTQAAPAVVFLTGSLSGLLWMVNSVASAALKLPAALDGMGKAGANFRYMPGQVVPNTAAPKPGTLKLHTVDTAADNKALGMARPVVDNSWSTYMAGLREEANLASMSAQKRAQVDALIAAANFKIKNGLKDHSLAADFAGRQANSYADALKILTPTEQAEVRRVAVIKQAGDHAEKLKVTYGKFLADLQEEGRIAGATQAQRQSELAVIQAAQVVQKQRGVAEKDLAQTYAASRKVLGEIKTAEVEAAAATRTRNELTRDILQPLREEVALAGKTREEREAELELLRMKQQYGESAVKMSEEELRNLMRKRDVMAGDDLIADMRERVQLAGMTADEAERESAVLDAMRITHGNLTDDQAQQLRGLVDARREAERMVGTATEVADVIGNWAAKGKVELSDLGNVFKRQLAQMVSEALLNPIVLPIMGSMGGSSMAGIGMGGGGSGLGGLSGLGNLGGLSSMMPSSGLGGLFGGIGSKGFGGLFDYAATDALGYGFTMPGSLGVGSLGGFLGGVGLGSMAGSLVFGNKADAGLGSMAGAALGQLLIPIPGVGAIIGGLAGGALGSMTGSSNQGAIANFGGDGTSSYLFKQGGGNNGQMATAAAQQVSAIISALQAQGVTVGMSGITGLSIGSDKSYIYDSAGGKQKLGGGDVEGVVSGILARILPGASGGTTEAQAVLSKYMQSGGINSGNLSQLTSDLGFANTLKDLDFSVKQLTQSEQALNGINAQYQQLIDKAAALGLSTDKIETARGAAIASLIDGFNETVATAILQIEDPTAAAAAALSAQQAQRIKEATALGADLTEVYRLNAIETEQLTRAQTGQLESNEALLSQAAQLAKQATDMNDSVRIEILGFTDPLAAALAAEERAGRDRVDQAREVGADIEQIEILNGLIRKKIITDFAASATNALEGGLPSPEVLAARAKQAAEFNDDIRIQSLGFTDAMQAALAIEDRAAQQRIEQAKALGADMLAVERLNGLSRQKILDDFTAQAQAQAAQVTATLNSAKGNLSGLVESLTVGNDSGLAPEQKYFALLTRYNQASRDALASPNDPLAIGNFQAAAQSLVPVAREFLGTSQSYGRLTGDILSTATRLGGDLADPSGMGRAMVMATTQGSGAIVDAIGAQTIKLSSMDENMKRLAALMLAVLNRAA